MYKIMDGNEACSYVSYKFTEVAGIYPITPASPMAEFVDTDYITEKVNAEIVTQPTRVVKAQAGNYSGMIGAGLLALGVGING